MFNQKSKSDTNEAATGSTTIIGSGTIITGDIESKADIRIDGVLIGNLKAKAKIIIGQNGSVEGNISGEQADVLGKVNGVIKVNDLLQLRNNANVSGDIYAGKLQVEPTANFNGQCHMGANVVELNAEITNATAINQ